MCWIPLAGIFLAVRSGQGLGERVAYLRAYTSHRVNRIQESGAWLCRYHDVDAGARRNGHMNTVALPLPAGTVHETIPADLREILTRDAKARATWMDITRWRVTSGSAWSRRQSSCKPASGGLSGLAHSCRGASAGRVAGRAALTAKKPASSAAPHGTAARSTADAVMDIQHRRAAGRRARR